jgi:hypothetical protein
MEIHMSFKSPASILLIAMSGSALASSEPTKLDATSANINHAGHIYFNIATGEKVTTLISVSDEQGAVSLQPGSEIWIADTGAQCADQGFSTSFFFGLDDPDRSTSLSLNAINFDWGDIALDTVIDMVQVHWVSDHADTDVDLDSMADGIVGFAATWTYWDAMNGRSPQLDCTALPIIQFRFENLPGEYPEDTATLAFWTADIDLGASFGNSLTFEIGDTDSDLHGASVHNPRLDLQDNDSDSIPDIDHDQDNLADWGWSIQFIQPGTIDLDNADGDDDTQTGIDGDPLALATAGIVFGSPTPGHAEMDTAGGWDWIPDGPTAGATENAFALGTTTNPDGTGNLTIAGTFFFGGLDCTADPTTGQYTPAAHFQTILYGVGGVACPVDIAGNPDGTPDGLLNFLDVSAYLSLFSQGEPCTDFAGNPDGSPDGLLNFIDVSAFLAGFAAGCP